MRHMYNSDGMIAYAGKPRASSPWKGSRYRPRKVRHIASEPTVTPLAEGAYDRRTRDERIRDILAASKWSNGLMNREG